MIKKAHQVKKRLFSNSHDSVSGGCVVDKNQSKTQAMFVLNVERLERNSLEDERVKMKKLDFCHNFTL